MKSIFDATSMKISRRITRDYSTSFSIGIHMLHRSLHEAIYSIYGYVRVADEIVDSFHGYDQRALLDAFEKDTFQAIRDGISTNPILHAFQLTVNHYGIDHSLIRTFLQSMRMDLQQSAYSEDDFRTYILGSAEVVGLMCLSVFVEGDRDQYNKLKPAAMKLGAAFQKVNFLRDIAADYHTLGRTYFPGIDIENLTQSEKREIEESIHEDFEIALTGIRGLPLKARFGVYTAYIYYKALFRKIENTPVERIINCRIRIPNYKKLLLLIGSYLSLKTRSI